MAFKISLCANYVKKRLRFSFFLKYLNASPRIPALYQAPIRWSYACLIAVKRGDEYSQSLLHAHWSSINT